MRLYDFVLSSVLVNLHLSGMEFPPPCKTPSGSAPAVEPMAFLSLLLARFE